MKIPSGTTDQYIYFVAVDATDFTTRETGLSSFTVYGSKDGAAAAAFTSPTINETDSSNMPGVYELLLDEQTTLAAGNDTEELCLHITHAGMAPVTRTIELYRPKITIGYTLTVESDGDLAKVNTLDGHTAQTGDSYSYLGTNLGALGANATEAGGTGDQLTAIPWNASWDAEVQSECEDAIVNYKLDHLVHTADSDDVADNSIIAKMVASDGDWSGFSSASDANEAIADYLSTNLGAFGANATEAGGTGDQLTAINLPNQTMNITGNITGNLSGSVGSVTATVNADIVKISTSTTAANNLELACLNYDTTTGLAGTALPNANAGDAGGLIVSATGIANIDTIYNNVATILTSTSTTIPNAIATVDGNVDSIYTAVITTIPGTLTTIGDVVDDIYAIAEDLPLITDVENMFTEIKGATWSSSTDTLENIRDDIAGLNNITAAAVVTALMADTSCNNGSTYTFADQIQMITSYVAGAVTVTDNAYEYGDIDDDAAVITNTITTSARSTVIA